MDNVHQKQTSHLVHGMAQMCGITEVKLVLNVVIYQPLIKDQSELCFKK